MTLMLTWLQFKPTKSRRKTDYNFFVWPKWFVLKRIAFSCLTYPGLSLRIEDAARGKMAKLPIYLILHILLGLLSRVEERFLGLNVCTAAQGLIRESENIWVFYPLMSPDGGAFRNLPTAKWSKRYFPVKSSYLQQNSQMGDKSLWVLLSYLWSKRKKTYDRVTLL